MENQPPPRGDEEIAGSMEEEDRISQLPLHILHHHILSLLSHIDAVRTCILSKSWRYLGSTRPKFEYHQTFEEAKKLKFTPDSVVENTFQRYYDQSLSIQELILTMSWWAGPSSLSILNKWIPIALMKMGVKLFSLSISSIYRFLLPSVIFQAEFLEELHLVQCELNQINNNCIVFKLQMLKRLELQFVYINDETFEKMMSSCPLIQHLVLDECKGLSAIKVNKARNLKHFDCNVKTRRDDRIGSVEIDDDAPSLETIRIQNCQNWYNNRHCYFLFPRLKSLYLGFVHLPTELLNNLSSNNCPSLQVLELHCCSGFKEFKLSNHSIKRLVLSEPDSPIKADIDAANMLYFELSSIYLPSISFATTSRECKSRIRVGYFFSELKDNELLDWSEWKVWLSSGDVLSTWYIKLYEFLKALRESQISLDICYLPNLENQGTSYGGGSCELVVVEHLCLRKYYSSFEIPVLLNCLFRICRPRYIGLSLYVSNSKERQLAESIRKSLENKGETRQCDSWLQDLEESSIQVLDNNTNEWHPVQDCALSDNHSIRFRLKWRDLS